MALNLSSAFGPRWVFQTANAGTWDVYPYNTNASIIVEKYAGSGSKNADEAIIELIVELCALHLETKDGGARREPTPEDMALFTREDIENFAKQFIENRKSMLSHAVEEVTKAPDQDYVSLLLNILDAENKRQSAKIKETFASMNASLTGLLGSRNDGIRSVSKDLLEQSSKLERSFGSVNDFSIASSHHLRLPPMPENPVYDTNKRLADMTNRLDDLIAFGENALGIMNGLQVASAKFLEDFSTEAQNNSSAAWKAIAVGALAVLLSIAQIVYAEFWRVPKDSAEIQSAITQVRGEIDDLRLELLKSLEEANSIQQESSNAFVEVARSSSDENAIMIEALTEILKAQQEKNEELLQAIRVLTDRSEGSTR